MTGPYLCHLIFQAILRSSPNNGMIWLSRSLSLLPNRRRRRLLRSRSRRSRCRLSVDISCSDNALISVIVMTSFYDSMTYGYSKRTCIGITAFVFYLGFIINVVCDSKKIKL